MRKFVLGILVFGVYGVSSGQSYTSTIATNGGEQDSIQYINYQASPINTVGQGIKVWSFTVTDAGDDGLPTKMSRLFINAGPSNQANWSSTIRYAALFTSGTRVGWTVSAITATQLQLENSVVNYVADTTIGDGSSVTYDLYISFKDVITDNLILQFQITQADPQDDYFEIDLFESSGFATFTATSSVVSAKNKIAVVADRLEFESGFNTTFPNSDFPTQVNAADALGNLDLDAGGSVTLSRAAGAGTLSAVSGLTKSIASGTTSWNDLRLDLQGSVTLAATHSGSLTSVESDTFQVTSALFLEDFFYANNAALVGVGWSTLVGPTSFSLTAGGAGLSYSDYPGSDVGLRTYLTAAADECLYATYPVQSDDSVYFSMIVNFTGAGSGDMFASLGPASPGTTDDLRVCLFAKNDGGNLKFGISKAPVNVMGSGADYTTSSYGFNQLHLVIVKYTFIAGSNNDRIDLYVDEVGMTEPASPTLTASLPSSDFDVTSLGSIALLQMSANGPTGEVDGIRVDTNWTSATAPLPVALTNFTATGSGLNATLVWSTATELDNFGFEVERRPMPIVGSKPAEFRTIAFLPGAGTSTSPKDYSFTDANVAAGRYAYRLKQIDRDGSSTYYGEAEVEIGLTAKAFTLNEAFPNPFNPTTTIDFSLADAGTVSLKIYDVLGREVATVFNGAAEAGRLYRATWDASAMPSGMYFARLESGGSSAMKRLMLVK